MRDGLPRIVVAGHICLDIIPEFPPAAADSGAEQRIEPGRLFEIGPPLYATGGAVANTGLALHRLGVPVTLLGKVGDDLFGTKVLEILAAHAEPLAEGMIVSPAEATSYTVVISPPNTDRSFLHCPGVNDTLLPEELRLDQVQDPALFHFGYPPLMRRFYEDGGQRARDMLRSARELGMLTSLDMALPDPESDAGRIDWPDWLDTVLPEVDFFLPSIEEACFMLGVEPTKALLWEVAETLLEKGVSVVLLKLGEEGLFLRSGELPDRLAERIQSLGGDPEAWSGCDLQTPTFQTEVVGTTGAGDSSIAGFLTGLVGGDSPSDTLELAAAVGACSVEASDATSGIPSLGAVRGRIADGWGRP